MDSEAVGLGRHGQAASPNLSPHRPIARLPLARGGRRLSYELRLRLWLLGLAFPAPILAGWLVWLLTRMPAAAVLAFAGASLLAAVLAARLFAHITRPLQTLSNVVAALREDDYSFRARGARRGDSLGDLALEINALANMLQTQRGVTRDALTLAERVMDAMRTPVLAFAPDSTLRLLNPAAENAFSLGRAKSIGLTAEALGLPALFGLADGAVYAHPAVSGVAGETRWSLRRSTFRLGGVPHHLFVFSDINAALREEERLAWQRLVRVLSHEINNSLAPIASIAGSLRGRLAPAPSVVEAKRGEVSLGRGPAGGDLVRGLQLIEERALALHHFLQAYQQLTRLPRPNLQPTPIGDLLQRAVALETRLAVELEPGPALTLALDPAQMEQMLINLLRNAAEAALSTQTDDDAAAVQIRWTAAAREWVLQIEDNGPGLTDTANLFVPFYTTKPEGTGIGLALAKQIASGHGGTLTLRNREDAPGCLAEARFPLSPAGGASPFP